MVRQAQAASKAKDGCQPYRAGCRAVDAVLGVEAEIVEVQERRLPIKWYASSVSARRLARTAWMPGASDEPWVRSVRGV